MAEKVRKIQPLPFLALLLAWLIPGAGHAYIGRVRRGIIIFITIGATFWAGIAMGGVMTVDSVKERWWFIAEMFTGVHGLVSWQRTNWVYEKVMDDDEISSAVVDGDPRTNVLIDKKLQQEGIALVSPMETIARAYAGVAGLLNLMCIFDAVLLSLMGVSGEPELSEEKEDRRKQK